MDEQKLAFLQQGMFEKLEALTANSAGSWGKMNAQQMLEHLTDFFEVSTGKQYFELAVPEEYLPKYKEFLLSDKAFRENTKAPASVLGEDPLPMRQPSFEEAKLALERAVEEFVSYFSAHPAATTLHPAFGLLNYEEWVLLHDKHVKHHFRQFTLI